MVFWLCIPCLALVLYFLILSIFIPKYRLYIKEAWMCFMDKLRGRKCPVSYDKKMHEAFVMWLAKKNKVGAAKFFQKKRNFDILLITGMIVISIITTYLFFLLVKFLLVGSPCDNGGGVCIVGS